MKTTINTLVLLFFFAGPVKAQLTQGAEFVSADMYYSKQSRVENDTNNFWMESNGYEQINAGISGGTFVKDNLLIGLRFGYGKFKGYVKSENHSPFHNSESSGKSDHDTYSVGFFSRQYKRFFNDKFAVFLFEGIDVAYGKGKNNATNDILNNFRRQNYTTEVIDASLSVRPGLAYFITKRFAIEILAASVFKVGYKTTSITEAGKVTLKNEDVSSGFNFVPFGFNLGFNYFFGFDNDKK